MAYTVTPMTTTAQAQHGYELAQADLQHCETREDVIWYMLVAKGNGHLLADGVLGGYLDAMDAMNARIS